MSKCPQKYVLKTHKNNKGELVFLACNFDRVRCCLLSWTNLVKLKTIVQASNLVPNYSSSGGILYVILFLTFILPGDLAYLVNPMQKKNSGSMCDKILEHLPIMYHFWCTLQFLKICMNSIVFESNNLDLLILFLESILDDDLSMLHVQEILFITSC